MSKTPNPIDQIQNTCLETLVILGCVSFICEVPIIQKQLEVQKSVFQNVTQTSEKTWNSNIIIIWPQKYSIIRKEVSNLYGAGARTSARSRTEGSIYLESNAALTFSRTT